MSLSELRRALHPFVERPLRNAIRSFGQDVVIYVALVWLALTSDAWWVHTAVGVGIGLVITNLFMIAHDAAHGSFTDRPRLNAVIARGAFALCFHPVSAWRHVHHDVHHRSTNDHDVDVVWRPLGLDEYRRCRPAARRWHRLCRTTPGLALYYLVEIWGRELMGGAPKAPQPAGLWRGRLGIVAILVGWAVAGWSVGGWWGAVSLTVIPLSVLSWAIGFVVFFNHTHPRVPWAAGTRALDQQTAQVVCTVRLAYPPALALFLGHIMEHTAHHVHPGVPQFNLARAQARLDALIGQRIVEQRWSPRVHRHILRTCRLYDSERHLWLDWDGHPTAATFVARPADVVEVDRELRLP